MKGEILDRAVQRVQSRRLLELGTYCGYSALLQEGTSWRTTEHKTHLEYQSWIKDLVLESEYLNG